MDTTIIKCEAISEILGDLFTGTCKYGHMDVDRWGEPMERDTWGLELFRRGLCTLADDLQQGFALDDDLEKLIKLTQEIGFKVGHVTGRYRTGTWGVRLSELEKLRVVLSLPRRELLPMRSDYTVYDLPCRITGYRVSSLGLWATMTPYDPQVREFPVDFSWEALSKSDCPIYESEVK